MEDLLLEEGKQNQIPDHETGQQPVRENDERPGGKHRQ